MLDKIKEHKSLCIRQIADNRAEQIGFYRFLQNEKVTREELIENQLERYRLSEQKGHILCISDTTDVRLSSHRGRLKPDGVGYVGTAEGLGFYIHPTLLVEVEESGNGRLAGYSSIQIWHRDKIKGTRHSDHYKQLAIEEKESYKWIKSADESKERLPQARMLTMIGDREADMFEEFVRVPDPRTHILIRCCQDRYVADGTKLFEKLDQENSTWRYEILIEADQRIGRRKRKACLEVKWIEVDIAAPNRYRGDTKSVRLRAIEAKEIGVSREEAINWRLLTTHEVKDFSDARRMIEYYRWRWQIEQMFRVLKRQGLNVEASQLENAEAIKKMCVMAIPTALHIMQLVGERHGSDKGIKEGFTESEIECLQAILPKVEGKTEKQKNPFAREKLAWGAWIIARMGGWSGYKSDRPAGVITIKNGLEKFNLYYQGYRLARGDVCTR